MKSADYLLRRMALLAREYGTLTCSPVQPGTPCLPELFEDEDGVSLTVSGTYGNLLFQELKSDNYNIRYNRFNIRRDIFLTIMIDEPSIGLHFNLKHPFRFSLNNFYKGTFLRHQYNLFYTPHVIADCAFAKQEEYVGFTIDFEIEYLQRCEEAVPALSDFLQQVEAHKPTMICGAHLPSTPEKRAIIQNILHCGFTGALKKMYLETKVHELLLLSLQHIPSLNDLSPKVMLRQSDIEKLHAAREYIIRHLDNPCTLKELAHNVGLNDFKLKNGFKQIYGTTVFGLMHEERMQKASMLLRETKMSVLDISIMTGYKNLSNFTAAFKKRFGYPPSTIKRKSETEEEE